MDGYHNALKKRKELDGSSFDVWAFDQKHKKKEELGDELVVGTWDLSKDIYRLVVSSSLTLCVSKQRYESLRSLHRGTGEFGSDMLLMALRYAPLSKGLQAALPLAVFQLLQHELNTHVECFASPLNHQLSSWCSAFADDACFGGNDDRPFCFFF